MRSDALEYDLKIGMIGNSSLTEEEKYIFEGVLGHPPKVYAEKELLYQYLLFAFSLVSGGCTNEETGGCTNNHRIRPTNES